jgi:hypothetical protein
MWFAEGHVGRTIFLKKYFVIEAIVCGIRLWMLISVVPYKSVLLVADANFFPVSACFSGFF